MLQVEFNLQKKTKSYIFLNEMRVVLPKNLTVYNTPFTVNAYNNIYKI